MKNKVSRFFFGDDIFISYARKDATNYSLGLANKLAQQNLSCFLDQWGTPPGKKLPASLLNALSNSTIFILLGTPNAVLSDAVKDEVDTFLKTGRTIIPISFEGALQASELFNRITGISIANESIESFENAIPSEHIINRIINAEGFISRNKRLRKYFWITAIAVLLLLGIGGLIGVKIQHDLSDAQKATSLELSSTATLNHFKTSGEEIPALENALSDCNSLMQIVATEKLEQYPTIAPVYALQNILDNMHEKNSWIPTDSSGLFEFALNNNADRIITRDDETIDDSVELRLWTLSGKNIKSWKIKTTLCNIQFAPDGNIVNVLGRFDSSYVRFYDSNGNFIKEWDDVSQISFCPDKKVMAIVNNSGIMKLIDTSGKLLNTFQNDAPIKIGNIAFSSNGKRLITINDQEGIIQVWDITGKLVKTLSNKKSIFNTVQLSPNGMNIVATDDVDRTFIWNIDKDVPDILDGHASIVALSPLSQLFATFDDKYRKVRLWNYSGELQNEFTTTGSVTKLLFDQSGDRIITSGADGVIRFWDLSGKSLFQLNGHAGYVRDLICSPDNTQLITSGADGIMRIWKIAESSLTLYKPNDYIKDIAFTSRDQVITISEKHCVQYWDIPNGKKSPDTIATKRHDIPFEFYQDWGSVDTNYWIKTKLSYNGKLLGTANADTSISIWNIENNKSYKLKRIQGTIGIIDLFFSPNNENLAWTEAWGVTPAKFYNIDDNKLTTLGINNAYSICFDYQKRKLAIIDGQGKCHVTDISGKLLYSLPDRIRFLDADFNNDGTKLCTAGIDGSIGIWDTSGHELYKGVGHTGSIQKIIFSPGGDRLASLGTDGMVRVWTINGRLIAEFPSHQNLNDVSIVARNLDYLPICFNNDGSRLAIIGDDGKVRIWEIGSLENLIQKAKDWLKDYCLTHDCEQ